MSALTLTLILSSIVVLALAVVSVANQMHQRHHRLRQRALHLRRRIAELEEMALTVEPVVESLAIARLINEENLTLTREALELEPDSEALAAHLERAETMAEDFADPQRPRQLCRLLDSDATIARTRYYLNEAARILRRKQGKDHLTSEELDVFLTDLTWAHLMVHVISMIGQGHKAASAGNPLLAFAYYRKAQHGLMDSMHRDERRHEMIRQLSDVIAGRRPALSPELMPETFHNPAAPITPPPEEATASQTA